MIVFVFSGGKKRLIFELNMSKKQSKRRNNKAKLQQ